MRNKTAALTLGLAALGGMVLVLLFGWPASQAPPTILVVTPRPVTSPTPTPPTRPVSPTPEPTALEQASTAQKPSLPECHFVGGFEVLVRSLGRDTVGGCLEDEHSNQAGGNVEQRTTRGLLVWLWDQNLSAFTDGATTWYGCPYGVERRPSDEPFACAMAPTDAEQS